MIISERFSANGKEFIRTYSDARMKIHGGMPEGDYAEATDPAELGRTYIETDIPVEEDEEADPEEIINILTGEEEA